MASPSFIPKVFNTFSNLSDPNIRIRSSSRDKKNEDFPGSPCLPERPLN